MSSEGVGVYPSRNFIPNGAAAGECRNKDLRVQGAVNKVLMGWYRKGNGISIQTRVLGDWLERDRATGRQPSFHFSPLQWTYKLGKAEGKVICDCSAATEGQIPLNSEETKARAIGDWGEIPFTHVTKHFRRNF